MTVFTTSGRTVGHEYVNKSSHFHFRFVLPAGYYEVNAGKDFKYRYSYNCRPRAAHVRPARTTRVDVRTGCGTI